jgi:ribosomal-protein-alanine N-acetyltransferase
MSATLVIRPAGMSDADTLAVLHATSFDESWSGMALAKLLALPTSFALVAHGPARAAGDGQSPAAPLGFILCRIAGGECEVLTIAVLPVLRQQGIATALLETALARASAAGARAAFLEVAVDNEAARRLYARLGFRRVGRRTGYYRHKSGKATDALILRQGIASA